EADLLWRASITHAELGRRDRAIDCASVAVDRLRGLGDPTADWFAHHLANYQSGAEGAALAAPAAAGTYRGGSIDAGAWTAPHAHPAATGANGPGPLRLALSAAKSMAAFVGSG